MKKSFVSMIIIALVGVSSTAQARWDWGSFGIGAGVGLFGGLLLGNSLSNNDQYSRDYSHRDIYRNDVQIGVRLNWYGDNNRGYHFIDHQDRYYVRGGNDYFRDGRHTECRLVRSNLVDPRSGYPLNNYQANYRDQYVCRGQDNRWVDVNQNDCRLTRTQPVQVPVAQPLPLPQPHPVPYFQQNNQYVNYWQRPTITGYYNNNNQPRQVTPIMYQPNNGNQYVAPRRVSL